MPKPTFSLEVKPFEAKKLIAYQDGSVVSREILATQNTTITLFAFAQGQGLSEHTTPFNALMQILDGEAHITIGRDEYMVKAGEIIIAPANTPHALKASKAFKMMLTMARDPKPPSTE